MNPCVKCKKKGACPAKCYPRMDYDRHMEKLNRKLRKGAKKKTGAEGLHGEQA